MPFARRQAPLGISGHDVARARHESTTGQAQIYRSCERKKRAAYLVGIFFAVRLENQAIVLVRGEALLDPSLGSEHHPAPGYRGQVKFVGDQFDHSNVDQIVQAGHPAEQDFDPHTIVEQFAGALTYGVGGSRHALDIICAHDATHQVLGAAFAITR